MHLRLKRISLALLIAIPIFYGAMFLMGQQVISRETADAALPDDETLILAGLQTNPDLPSAIDYHTTIDFLHSTASEDSSSIIQHEAVLALGKIGAPARLALEDLLQQGAWLVRAEAAQQLGLLKLSNSIPRLVDRIQHDADPWVRFKAGQALVQFGDDSFDCLQEYLFTADNALQRQIGAQLLAQFNSEKAKAALLALLQDTHYAVRREAARAAAHWSDPEVAQALIPLLSDRRSDVRLASEQTLASMPEVARELARELIGREGYRNREQGYDLLAQAGTAEDLAYLTERSAAERSRTCRRAIGRAEKAINDRTANAVPEPRELAAQIPVVPSEFSLIVDCSTNQMFLVRGGEVLRHFYVATGMNREVGRYYFHTPRGEREILRKVEDPLWVRPAWAWLERGEEVPSDPRERWRGIPGVMGKYKLELGSGYAIHGTNRTSSIGRYATHGCIRVGAVDLAAIYPMMEIGDKVYIF